MYIKVGSTNLKSLKSFRQMSERLARGDARTELQRGVTDAGRKTKTRVQKAVTKQMALKPGNYAGYVVAGTRGIPKKDLLAFDIFGVKGGAQAEKYKGLKSLSRGNRMNVGRKAIDRGTVRSGVWNAPRIFKRSFTGTSGGFFAMRPASEGEAAVTPKALWTFGRKPGQPRGAGGKFGKSGVKYGKVRRLFGPSLRDEIGRDEALMTFVKVGPAFLEQAVAKRLSKLVRF